MISQLKKSLRTKHDNLKLSFRHYKKFNFSKNNTFISDNVKKVQVKPAVIKSLDNTIGLPDELIDDQIILTHHQRHEIPSEDVAVATQEELDDNTIAKESRNLDGRKSQKGLGIPTTESNVKSFPHGYDKI